MKIIDDNLLNNFIDNDLSIEEKQFLQNEIEKNPELEKRYENLLLIHNSLKNSETGSTSIDFTKTLMQKISKNELRSLQQKRMLFFTLSFIGVIILGVLGYLSFELFNNLKISSPNNEISNYTKNFGDYISDFLGKKNLSVFGTVLSFIMLVGGYFLFEYQKNVKKHLSH